MILDRCLARGKSPIISHPHPYGKRKRMRLVISDAYAVRTTDGRDAGRAHTDEGRRAAAVDATQPRRVIAWVGGGVELQKIVTVAGEDLVEVVRGRERQRGVIVLGGDLDAVVADEIGGVEEGGAGDHILVKIGVLLTAVFALEREGVFDVTDGRLVQPMLDVIERAAHTCLEACGKCHIARGGIPLCLVLEEDAKVRLVVEKLRRSTAVGDLARDRLHMERQKPRFFEVFLDLIIISAAIAKGQEDDKQTARDEVVDHRIVRVAVHSVLVKAEHLRGKLCLDDGGRVGKTDVVPHPLAHGGEARPVGIGQGGVACDHVVAGIGIDGGKARLPRIDAVRGYDALALVRHNAKDDLLDRKIVGGAARGDLLTAKIHHLKKEREQIVTVAVGDENAEVGSEAGKAVLGQPRPLDLVKIADDVLVGVGTERLCHQLDVAALHIDLHKGISTGKARGAPRWSLLTVFECGSRRRRRAIAP